MNRRYLVRDQRGEHALSDADLPVTIGGAGVAEVVLPNFPTDRLAAYLALADGHPYLQPADQAIAIFHNHERVQQSIWLKSGDLIEMDQALMRWDARGDKVIIEVGERSAKQGVTLVPPTEPNPDLSPDNSTLPDVAPVRQRRSSLRYVASGLMLVLLLGALFVLFATPVRLSVEPQPDHIALRGFPPSIPLWGRYLSLPGDYELVAGRDGYYPLAERLKINSKVDNEFRFALRPLPGLVTINVEPSVPFILTVDGVETTTDEQGFFAMPHGSRTIGIDTERYLPQRHQIEIEGFGRQQQLNFELHPAWADVRMTTEPAGATVQIDGDERGVTPLETELMQGQREIQFSLAGYKTLTMQQSVTAGAALVLEDITLLPADGELVVQTDPDGATVSVDGMFRGTTPVTLMLASDREHTLNIAKAGHVAVRRTIAMQPEEERILQVDLQAEIGTIFLTSQPADASLLIDGQPAGSATQRLRLTTRPHRLEIRKSGYVTERITVTPSTAASQVVEVALRRLSSKAGASDASGPVQNPPSEITTASGHTLKLVQPSGRFDMGASRREAGRRANESQRSVELTRPFFLADKEVTNAQFRQFKPNHRAGVADGATLEGADLPVVNISWDDAARYCNWLSTQERLPVAYEEHRGRMRLIRPVTLGYRLPTEAEWAYAARVHQRSQPARYPWAGSYPPIAVSGNFADTQIADTLADVVPAGYDDGYRGPAPVGTYPESPRGFYDLGGNVAEWVNDYYTVYPAVGQQLVRDPLGPDSGQHRVVRGSSWRHGNITELRLSYRDYSKRPRNDLGFRIARYAVE